MFSCQCFPFIQNSL